MVAPVTSVVSGWIVGATVLIVDGLAVEFGASAVLRLRHSSVDAPIEVKRRQGWVGVLRSVMIAR